MAHDCPYFSSEFAPISEYIPPLRVLVDNETCDDYTLIKVAGANRHGILLKMVQILSDLDLIIFKSYIASDGDWFLNFFYVTDHNSHKVKDSALIRYIQHSFNIAQKQNISLGPTQVKICHGNIESVDHFASDCTALELIFYDHPGIFSEVTTLLFQLSYAMDSGEMWTHNGRAACILYLKEKDTGHPIYDGDCLVHLGEYVSSVMNTHHLRGELWKVRLRSPTNCRIHTERRLHQLLQMHKDFEDEPQPSTNKDDLLSKLTITKGKMRFDGASDDNGIMNLSQVSVETCKDRDYLVVNVRSRIRPKLMFDVVCALTDLEYDIIQGSICAQGLVAAQEYFVRRTNGCMVLDEMEKQSIAQSLAAAIDRRIVQGLKMEVCTLDRHSLLSDVTRTLRENNMSIKKMKFAKEDGMAISTFYVTDASSFADSDDINQQRLEAVRNEIGNDVFFEKKIDCNISSPARGRWSLFSIFYSLGRNLLSKTKRFFSIFNFIR